MRAPRVVHLSSVHAVDDTRIFYKECRSLAASGYDVTLVINAEGNSQDVSGVKIIAITQRKSSRLLKIPSRVWRVVRHATALKAEIYHLHDPELLPVAMILKLMGRKVIFDAHEHVAEQIMTKEWIPSLFRPIVAKLYRSLELASVRWFLDAIVVADPSQLVQYPSEKAVLVENFPILEEVSPASWYDYPNRPSRVSYVGAITRHRGAVEMLKAIDLVNQSVDSSLALAGRFAPETLEDELKSRPAWQYVEYHGFLDRTQVHELLAQSRIGIVVLHPIANYLHSQPVKLLEYMASGIPVVVCDFPYYRKYVAENRCGIMVDPLDPRAIAEAIVWLLNHPAEAQWMGERGRQAAIKNYSWTSQAANLIDLYGKLAQ